MIHKLRPAKGKVMSHIKTWWAGSFALFAVLSLSSMAGMSIGGGIYLAASILLLVKTWPAAEGQYFRRLLLSPYAIASYLLFFVSFLSLLYAQIFPPLGPELQGFSELKKYHHFLYPLFVALGLQFALGKKNESVFWKWWMVIGFLCAGMAVAQFWGASLFPASWLESRFFRAAGNSGKFHAQGLMYFHLSFASCMPFVAAPGLARALWPAEGDTKSQRLMWLALGIGGSLATFYSYSRIAWVALMFLLVAFGFLKKPRYGILTLVAVMLTAMAVWSLSPSMQKRWVEARAGVFERKIVWAGAWEMFERRPLLGVGFGRTGAYSATYAELALGKKPEFSSHAHDNTLDILASMGLLGFFAYAGWWLYLFWESLKCFRFFPTGEKWMPAAAIAGFLAFQVNGLTQVNFWDGKSQHALMVWCGVVLFMWGRRKSFAVKSP